MATQNRYDKAGKQLPDTGRGCGCQLCAASGAARYERRADIPRSGGHWSEIRRSVVRLISGFETFAPLADGALAAYYRGRVWL